MAVSKHYTVQLASLVFPACHCSYVLLQLLFQTLQVAEYYSQVARLLDTEPCIVIAKKYKEWPKLMKIKVLYFQAISHVSEITGMFGLYQQTSVTVGS